MLYTTLTFSVLWMQNLIPNEPFTNYTAVKAEYIKIMAICTAVCFVVTPFFGYINDKTASISLICSFFLAHEVVLIILICIMDDDYNSAVFGTLIFLSLILTIATAISVMSHYTRKMPADVRGTMLGLLAFGSQFFVLIFLSIARGMT